MAKILQINPGDDVAVAMDLLSPGQQIGDLTIHEMIQAGHKVALHDIAVGEPVKKYGYSIGVARLPIKAGSWVHTHNLESNINGRLEGLRFYPRISVEKSATSNPPVFQGFRRPDGRAAVRNEIWIINTVGCVNRASEQIATAANQQLVELGVEGVYAFPHPFGCSQLGDDLEYTQKILAGLVNHPNAGAVLLLGLGCENNQMRLMLDHLGPQDSQRIRYFNAQEVGDEVQLGLKHIHELSEYARTFKRRAVSVSELILGAKCGGSDGFSGITANPLVGKVADRLVDFGGTVLLSEVPEMFGAEQVLLQRATDEAVFNNTLDMVNNFRDYFRRYNQPIDENPSPGNIQGGITTLAEKSLGCVQKGGHSPIRQVVSYGNAARPRLGALALVESPGNDGVSSTAMTVAGAHILLFTTGRGTPMGFPVPTIKISSNSALAQRKGQWIDFDAGRLSNENADPKSLADELFNLVLKVASGETHTRNEINGCREIAIWKNGVTL
ncbi:MAG TPA: altronate dehydratase family protein [Phycisphaerae bacterium]|nr:altronate dehydratase family protein [Phycisphaerae bacterium]